MAKTKIAPPTRDTNDGNAGQVSDSRATTLGYNQDSSEYPTIQQVGSYFREGISDRDLARALILKLLCRVDRFSNQIETAFLGQPFNLKFPPDAPVNQNRFGAYLSYHSRVTSLLLQLVQVSAAERTHPATEAKEGSQRIRRKTAGKMKNGSFN